MASFIQRIFEWKKSHRLPKISFSYKEGIDCVTEHGYLYIYTSFDKRRVYAGTMNKWKDGQVITKNEKEQILEGITRLYGKRKFTVVINIDHDKLLWEELCTRHNIMVEYESDEEIKKSQFDMLLSTIRKGGTVVWDNVTMQTEAALVEYWRSDKNRWNKKDE